jgi:hypothetical protein
VKFDYILITLVAAAVVVFLLNPFGQILLLDGRKVPAQTYFTPPLTPRTWQEGGIAEPVRVSADFIKLADPNIIKPNPFYTGGDIYRTPRIGEGISTTTQQILKCFKFIVDSTCVLVPN